MYKRILCLCIFHLFAMLFVACGGRRALTTVPQLTPKITDDGVPFQSPSGTPTAGELDGFFASTGSGETGNIVLNFKVTPIGAASIRDIKVVFAPGEFAPACTSMASENLGPVPAQPVQTSTVVHHTPVSDGGFVSYRVCVTDKNTSQIYEYTSMARAYLEKLPAGLDGFAAFTGSQSNGDIILAYVIDPLRRSSISHISAAYKIGLNAPAGCEPALGALDEFQASVPVAPYSGELNFLHNVQINAKTWVTFRACVYAIGSSDPVVVATVKAMTFYNYTLSAPLTVVQTGSAPGEIKLNALMPPGISDLTELKIVRWTSTEGPFEDCESAGSDRTIFVAPFPTGSFPIVDQTGVPNGQFNYRICIIDSANNRNSDQLHEGVRARAAPIQPPVDLDPPPSLAALSATKGINARNIFLSWRYPSVTTDYQKIQVRRLKIPLSVVYPSCSSGIVVKTLTRASVLDFPAGQVRNLPDTTDEPNTRYSYRICIYDSAGNVNGSSVASSFSGGFSGWVQIPRSTGQRYCPSFCDDNGMMSAVSPERAQCASGENRVFSGQQGVVDYYFGTWGTLISAPSTARSSFNFCYRSDQLKDYDPTDVTVACWCRSH